jgi:hypothetical protein
MAAARSGGKGPAATGQVRETIGTVGPSNRSASDLPDPPQAADREGVWQDGPFPLREAPRPVIGHGWEATRNYQRKYQGRMGLNIDTPRPIVTRGGFPPGPRRVLFDRSPTPGTIPRLGPPLRRRRTGQVRADSAALRTAVPIRAGRRLGWRFDRTYPFSGRGRHAYSEDRGPSNWGVWASPSNGPKTRSMPKRSDTAGAGDQPSRSATGCRPKANSSTK